MENQSELSLNLPTINNIPPLKLERNEYGLLKHVNYTFGEDSFIDWRKMINPKFITPNKERTTETDITKLDDSKLLILLGGLKELAQIRGFERVDYETQISHNYVLTKCTIDWIPNYETEGKYVSFSALADTHPDNTKSFCTNFLAAIAENRAFVRAVRNFLKINIVSYEEIGKTDSEKAKEITETKDTPLQSALAIIKPLMEIKGIDFERIKAKLIDERFDDAANFNQLEDIPLFKINDFIARLIKLKDSKS